MITRLVALRGGALPLLTGPAVQQVLADGTLYMGTAMAALSGSITAGQKEMDLFGCVVLALMTAIGGGTLRDMILARRVYWLADQSHLLIALAVSVLAFTAWPRLVSLGLRDSHLVFLWSDAIGMASSCIAGTHVGLEATSSGVVGVVCGTLTAVAGGIARDVMTLERPRALHAERSMYAFPALLGATAHVLLVASRHACGDQVVPQWATAVVPWAIALLLRAAAWTFRLALPHWARKQGSFRSAIPFLSENAPTTYEIKVDRAQGTNPILQSLQRRLQQLRRQVTRS